MKKNCIKPLLKTIPGKAIVKMIKDYILLSVIGIGAGALTAAGYFAVVAAVGVITRFAEYTKTASKIRLYEMVLSIGAITGSIFIIFEPHIPLHKFVVLPIGFICGIFTGCFLLSLAEAVKGLPIFLRKGKIQKGISAIILSLAIGKTLGSLYYFCCYLLQNKV